MRAFARLAALAAATLSAGAALAQPNERRCGWLANPSPANWWLTDRGGTWTMAIQGGYQAPGMDGLPDMTTAGWVRLNGSYGYGCACITGRFDPHGERRVIRITRGEPLPLARCERDPAIRPSRPG